MDKAFWLERWRQQQIGFHQSQINPWLIKYGDEVLFKQGGPVFFPLCGKSTDMIYVANKGHKVVGVELSPLAIEQFFKHVVKQVYQIERTEKFTCYYNDSFILYCGDFFDLTISELKGVRGVFDRASLIALPKEMRVRYMQHMFSLLSPDSSILLICLDYECSRPIGPPFNVSRREVELLCDTAYGLQLLDEQSAELPEKIQHQVVQGTGLTQVYRIDC